MEERIADRSTDVKKQHGAGYYAKFAVLTAVACFLASVAATELVLLIIFSRYTPVSTKSFPIERWAADGSIKASAFEFTSGRNTLKGYSVVPNDPHALIVIAHGMNANSDEFEPIVRYFAECGYAVLIYDGTAAGRSEGRRVTGLQQPRYDLRAAVQFVNECEQYKDLPIVLLGHSAGAYGAAMEADRSAAAAVICVSGFDSPLATMRARGSKYVPIYGDLELPFLALHEFVFHGKDAAASASAAVKASAVPALIIHGADDSSIALPISIFGMLVDDTPENAELLLVDDQAFSAHGNILISDGGEVNTVLLSAIDGFLDRVLETPSAVNAD
ncbi:MAG: alpha/beta fold hydrolase [Clostridia bacterium]|nr:alpha/beta fold hydrolase [Clostridia bacterium]